jgi:RND family efflux transporter MFP subunit
MKRLFVFLGIIAVIGIVAGAGYLGYRGSQPVSNATVQAPPTIAVDRGDVQQTIDAPGQLTSTHEFMVGSSVGGKIAQINAHPGETVKAGDALAQIDDTDLQSALRKAQADLASAQAAYDAALAKNAHRNDQIVVAKASLDKATITLQSAQHDYDAIAWRPDVGMTPQSAALQKATIDYQSALASYNLAAADINDSAVRSAAGTLVGAQETVANDQRKIEQAKIVAPFDGIVLEVLATPGATIAAGASIIHLADPHALEARTTVTEEDYPLARLGQTAQIYFDAQPDIVVDGHVTYIVPLRDSSSTSPVYPVYIGLDQVPAGLAPGMTVDAKVSVAKGTNVLRLPRALLHARANNTADVQVWNPALGKTENRTITVGLRGDQYMEIVSGLNEGELVVSR